MASAIAQSQPPPRPPGSPWSLRDAATYLGISERHLTRLIDGKLVKSIIFGRRRFVPAEEMIRLANQGATTQE
jgi:AraC-like DNA-binding protein